MKDFRGQRWLSAVMAAAMTISLASSGLTISAAEGVQTGTPYTAAGTYDVNIPHVMINQVYGGSDDGAASHSFIELYNPCDTAVDLKGWELQYRSSADGKEQGEQWFTLSLTGTIPAKGHYLVRGTATGGTNYQVPDGDQEWELALHNKGVSVVLLCKDVTLDDSFAGAVTDANRPDGYVDLLAVQGNDADEAVAQTPPVYETAVLAEQSKKKAIRRLNYTDTDDNQTDAEIIDYSEEVAPDKVPSASGSQSTGEGEGPEAPEEPAQGAFRENSFEDNAALALERLNNVSIGDSNPDGAVAEIVSYNPDREEAYVVNGQDGLLYCLDVTENGLTKTGTKNLKTIIDGFTYGDMTSVAVDTVNDRIAVALQAKDYADNGRVVILDYDFELIRSYEVGVQPDMVTFSPDGRLVLSANEGEPREGYAEGTTDPAGTISIIDLEANTVVNAGFADFSSEELAQNGVLIGLVDGRMNAAAVDLEPEYIVVSADSSTAYVSLQEANAIATVDLESKAVTAVRSMGFKDLGAEENAVDLLEDGQYAAKTYSDAVGVYMPDAISLFEANGVTYLVTANEGDAREWGDYVNEAKEALTADDGTEAEKVRVLDKNCTTVPDADKEYLFGGRSFSIYNAQTMEQVYDSGNDFEVKTANYLPEWFNCSNDDIELDSRSAKKGPEPEAVTIGQVDGKIYAFIALERIGGVMVYDVTDPENVFYVNYINTRDFSETIKGDVSPEGLSFLMLDGKPMLLAACEVSGTVAAYAVTAKDNGNGGNDDTDSDAEPDTDDPQMPPAQDDTEGVPDLGESSLPAVCVALLGLTALAVGLAASKGRKNY